MENAGLKAENQLLKRQLEYFQNLFAKKSQKSTASTSSAQNRDSNPFAPAVDSPKHELQEVESELTDMEAQVVEKSSSHHKKRRKKSRRAESDSSEVSSSNDISFVLQRNDSILGD